MFPQEATTYAATGLTLWFDNMVPALFPFMVISSLIIRLDIAPYIVSFLHPILKLIFRTNLYCEYAIVMGFLCGFPMGARVTAELLQKNKITQQEAEFLIAFNNNIGPVYFTGIAIPLLQINRVSPYLFGMYGIPLLYGALLRYTKYRNMYQLNTNSIESNDTITPFWEAIDESIHGAVNSILMLCGYMILFNTLNLLPHFMVPKWQPILAPMLEITGGLTMLENQIPAYSLCMLHFGGFSCIAQTNSMLRNTGLSLGKYIKHKVNITILACIYYLLLSVCK